MRGMIAAALISLIVAGCHKPPPFDDRYNETARKIDQRATQLDAELNQASSVRPKTNAQPTGSGS